MTTNSSPKPRTENKRASRERIAAERAKAKAAERKREQRIRLGVAGIVILVVAAIAAIVIISNNNKQTEANKGALPQGVSKVGGGVEVGTASQPVLDLWEDFQCPSCKAFEASTGPTVDQLRDSGKVKVIYHPLSFLDQNLNNDSSARAAAAAGCAADAGVYPKYHNAVYTNQPEQEGAGFTDAQLLDFGKQAGLTGAKYDTFQACVKAGTYDKWVTQVAQSGVDNQISQTPTVKLDGKTLATDQLTPAGLTAAIEAAAKS